MHWVLRSLSPHSKSTGVQSNPVKEQQKNTLFKIYYGPRVARCIFNAASGSSVLSWPFRDDSECRLLVSDCCNDLHERPPLLYHLLKCFPCSTATVGINKHMLAYALWGVLFCFIPSVDTADSFFFFFCPVIMATEQKEECGLTSASIRWPFHRRSSLAVLEERHDFGKEGGEWFVCVFVCMHTKYRWEHWAIAINRSLTLFGVPFKNLHGFYSAWLL